MLEDKDIELFCSRQNYDLRESHNARWIDQKCTSDVVWSISDFILEYIDAGNYQFTAKDIWKSEYAKKTIAETFSKPGTDEKTAEREYDKVFGQPLCMLCYAGVLRDVSTIPSRHLYVVSKRNILEYIARNDIYALRFLYFYIEHVLSDSGLYPVFKAFLDKQDQANFTEMKDAFVGFYHQYTGVQKDYEPKRIFTKVINPLAFRYKKKGSQGGRMSEQIITRADLMYNQDNFRDIYRDKPKGVTRQEWLEKHPEIDRRDGYFEQQMAHSKKLLRKCIFDYRGGYSELTMFDDTQADEAPATQMHHIFPRNEFPDIMQYIENIIALTPNQHYGYAHPENNTQTVSLAAQKSLLIAKTSSIGFNLQSQREEHIYDFSNLLYVLSTGWNDDSVQDIPENDYADVLQSINSHY